jgi:hypothetical protein
MYAAVCSADVRWGTTGRTLTYNTLYSINSTQMYAQKYTDIRYFLEYPLGNS